MPSNTGSAPVVMDKPSNNSPAVSTPSTTASVAAASEPTTATKSVERPGSADAAAIAGQAIFNAKCGRCHGLKVVSDYTVDRWISVMQVMAMKANLTETEKENVLAYVKANAKR